MSTRIQWADETWNPMTARRQVVLPRRWIDLEES